MTVFGVILLVVAAVLVFVHVRARKKVGALLTASAQTVSQMLGTAKTLAGELGAGSFSEMVEVSGQVRCPGPLISPLGERPCVYYDMSVRRQYEEDTEERDAQGNVRRATRRGSETMSSQSERVDFELADQTGAIAVRLEGADFDGLTETVERFEPAGGALQLQLGRFAMSVPTLGHGRRTLGYQYSERVLPAEGRLTVIGQASDQGGEMTVGRGGPAFIVTPRTKAELVGGAQRTVKWTAVASGLLALAGVGLTVAGLIAS